MGSMDASRRSDREAVAAVTDGPPSRAVVQAVADADDSDPVDLPPLYRVLDPDALDAIFRDRPDGSVTFEYNGYTVTVRGTAEVTVV